MTDRLNPWVWRGLWALSILVAIVFPAVYVLLPVDGATGDLNSFTPQGYEVQWVIDPRPGGLQEGDIIVRAGGHTYSQWLRGAPRGPEWDRGGVVTYEIIRRGQPKTLHIEMQPLPFQALWRHWGLALAAGIGLQLIASFVFWMRPQDRAARWFMLCCNMFALQQIADMWNFQFAILPRPVYFWLHFLHEHLSYGMAFAAMVIAAMTFPTTHPIYERHTRLVTTALVLLFQAGIFGTFALTPSYTLSLQRSNAASVVMAGIYVLPAVWLLAYTIRHTQDAAVRAQVLYLLATVGTIAMLAIPLYYVPTIVMGRPIVPQPVMSAVVLAIPVAFAIAILRVKLYNIQFIISRSLIYAILSVLLLALFASSLFVINQVAYALTGGEQSVVAIAIAAAISGALFQPTRRSVQRFIDRRFYHIDIDYEAIQKLRRYKDVRPKLPGEKILWRGMELELVERGGMAEIYRGRFPNLGRTVAVKFLAPSRTNDPHAQKRFEREANIMSRMHHPNIIPVHEFGGTEAGSFIIMDYIDGPDLATYLKQQKRLPLNQALSIIADVAAALDYIHAQRLVHRDIKPSNIILHPTAGVGGPPFRAVLADFGIAKVVASTETNLTLAGTVGTFDYMSPEQIHGHAPVDGRTDIYALGILTYELLTGEKPFPASSAGPVLIAHLQQPPPDACSLVSDLPEGVAQAIIRAMAKRPVERFASAGEFLSELIAHSIPAPAASTPSRQETPVP